jgi:hypothetical protein
MFDFDVVAGPTNPTHPAKLAAPPAPKPMTSSMPAAAAAPVRNDLREPAPSVADRAGAQQ